LKLLFGVYFWHGWHIAGDRRGSFNFFEFWERMQAWCSGFTGAAAGNGNEGNGGCAKGKEGSDHGSSYGW